MAEHFYLGFIESIYQHQAITNAIDIAVRTLLSVLHAKNESWTNAFFGSLDSTCYFFSFDLALDIENVF